MHLSANDKDIPAVPLHWHEMHDELFRVVQGRVEVRIGNETRIYVPEDGEVRIPKRTLHSLKFFSGEECIFDERTDPMVRSAFSLSRRRLPPKKGIEQSIPRMKRKRCSFEI